MTADDQAPESLPSSPSPWRRIESAPKDGAPVDLWCVSGPDSDCEPEQGGIRLTDCSWREADEIFWPTGWMRVTDDGYYDFVEGPPSCEYGLPHWTPTHWMPLPEPPAKAQPAQEETQVHGRKYDTSNLHRPQDSHSGTAAIVGKWPGDETDEEIDEALK